MAFSFGNTIITDGLTLYLDALNPSSYPGSGTTWYDLSSQKNNGTLVASPTYNGNSFTFNGSTQRVGSFPIQIADTGSKTISTFVNPVDTTTSMGICGTYVGAGGGWGMLLNYSGDGEIIYFHAAGTTAGVNKVITAGNQWYHLAVSYNKSTTTVTFYKNGQQVGSPNTSVTTLTLNPDNGGIGSDSGTGGRVFSGKISNIQIYNRALSATEILQNYNALKGRFGL
jgi:hypothetical protein